ncbi:hypothetical protein AB9F45_38295, partial [Rhizobium leguminosarum]
GRRFPWLNLEGRTLGSTGERGEGWFDSVGLLQGFRKKARSLGVEYIEDEVVAERQSFEVQPGKPPAETIRVEKRHFRAAR